MQKSGHTWTTKCKDVELFEQQYKELVRTEISLFAHLMFRWIILMCISKNVW